MSEVVLLLLLAVQAAFLGPLPWPFFVVAAVGFGALSLIKGRLFQ